jgi:hypothetical protein
MLFIGFVLGAILGAVTAWRRKGNWLDMLQYAAGFGIAGGLLFFVVSLIFLRVS